MRRGVARARAGNHRRADDPGYLAGRLARRRGSEMIARQLLPQRVKAFLARRVLEFHAGPDPRDGVADGLGLARLIEACERKPRKQPTLHRVSPTVAVLVLSHS